jgi:hypothetical protein
MGSVNAAAQNVDGNSDNSTGINEKAPCGHVLFLHGGIADCIAAEEHDGK